MTAAVKPHDQCPHCGRYNNRSLASDAIIIRGDQILLGKRGHTGMPYGRYWALFGGHNEWDETIEETLLRETKEESNLTVTSYKLLGIYSNPGRHPRQGVSIAYVVEVEGEPLAGDDIDEVRWWPLNKLPAELAFDHLQIITDYLKSR
jgi:ADP-ribose pyrophosphatase YjhB (NUDIX family)